MKSKILLLMTILALAVFTSCASHDSNEMSDEVTAELNEDEMSDDEMMLEDDPTVSATSQDAIIMRNSRADDTMFEDRRVLRGVQSELAARGYEVGPIDGIVGPKTSSALRNFQEDANISVTGTVDRATVNFLSIDVAGIATGESTESFAE